MSISLNETVTEVRRMFRDVKWSDATLQSWVKDAVRDYSNHFPRLEELAGDATTGTYEYAFSDLCLGVIEVEYPTGETPPEFPPQRNHLMDSFFDGGNYYDAVMYPGQDDSELWLSDPETGSSYNVKYFTDYAWTASGSDYVAEVPDQHRAILVQYVVWVCWREMATIEKEKSEIESRYNVFAERVLRERQYYDDIIQAFKAARPHESRIVTWVMDKYDRIY